MPGGKNLYKLYNTNNDNISSAVSSSNNIDSVQSVIRVYLTGLTTHIFATVALRCTCDYENT